MTIFNISVSGLFTNLASLRTTSHNIANANVDGYSRQRVEQEQRQPQFIGGNNFGVGVEVGTVRRIFERRQQIELQTSTAEFNLYNTFFQQAGRVDGLLADSSTGINDAIQSFFTAVQGVVNEPASIPARQVMLSQAEGMVSRFDLVHSQLEAQVTELNGNIDTIAKEISTLAESIAKLNNQISSAPGGPPPDLLDQRDRELVQLSELVSVQTVEQADASLNVFIGTGQALVVDSTFNSLVAEADPLDPRNTVLKFQTSNSAVEVTDTIKGGKLGGLIDVYDQVIAPAFNALGRVAMSISATFNAQHQLGIDLNNELGASFFGAINDPVLEARRVINSTENTGTAQLSLTVDDPNQLNDRNYELFLNGGLYTVVDANTDQVITTFAPPGAVPATVALPTEGLSINFLSGAANNGDTFSLQATRNFGREFSLALSTPEQIAAASPVRAEQLTTNNGSGSIASVSVTDTTTPQFTTVPNDLSPPLRIEFDATAGEFSIYDISAGAPVLLAGGLTGFVPNQSNDMLALAGPPFDSYGYEITIEGDPQPGDAFDITYNTNGAGNNNNIKSLGDLQQLNVLDNSNSTYQQAFGRSISRVGVLTQSAGIKRDSSESLLFQAQDRKSEVSGVNLDEEAANLIKFQQAYEASAQVINVARTLFQTILDSVR